MNRSTDFWKRLSELETEIKQFNSDYLEGKFENTEKLQTSLACKGIKLYFGDVEGELDILIGRTN